MRQVAHQVDEPEPFLAEEVLGRHLHVGERQFGGVLGLKADLVQVAARSKPSIPRSTTSNEKPCAPLSGSVCATTMTRSALMPLVMKVGAVQDVMVTVLDGTGLDALEDRYRCQVRSSRLR